MFHVRQFDATAIACQDEDLVTADQIILNSAATIIIISHVFPLQQHSWYTVNTGGKLLRYFKWKEFRSAHETGLWQKMDTSGKTKTKV